MRGKPRSILANYIAVSQRDVYLFSSPITPYVVLTWRTNLTYLHFSISLLPQVQITIISTNQFHGCMQGLRKALEKEVTAAMATRRLPAPPTPAQLTALKENSKVAQSDPYKLRSFLKLIEEVRRNKLVL